MATKGLVFLDSKNAILLETLQSRLLEGNRDECEFEFSDFDDVSYRVLCQGDNIKVNISMRGLNELRSSGTDLVIDRLFPGLEVNPDPKYDFAIQFNISSISNPQKLLTDISELKRNLLSGPIEVAFDALLSKTSNHLPITIINYRPNETIFVCPAPAKIVVIFLVDFNDITDKSLARIFLQEFVEAQRSIRTAPPVNFSREPPLELANLRFTYNPDATGFLSFGLEERHITGDKKQTAITLLTGFRSYLYYHIKCSKTYLHMRMRKKVAGWLQVLNRARPEIETEKKTMGGKTFVRKP
uniref:Arp2/3 complex 34 kDa subunit n=1 Tax=Chromulina nebulosa TaxID=96789 RepID=A0A7S0XD73_9STRA|mmetsp:Transcript_4048/g.3636  ORF Transcript_4048/g.3636 Transcript_4048/m.3636 type:complete len:299 (+) Transcript_4048:23-919(+)